MRKRVGMERRHTRPMDVAWIDDEGNEHGFTHGDLAVAQKWEADNASDAAVVMWGALGDRIPRRASYLDTEGGNSRRPDEHIPANKRRVAALRRRAGLTPHENLVFRGRSRGTPFAKLARKIGSSERQARRIYENANKKVRALEKINPIDQSLTTSLAETHVRPPQLRGDNNSRGTAKAGLPLGSHLEKDRHA